MQAILASRIDRLPPAEKELLQTLAVIGREFSFGLLQRVVTKSEDELNRILHDLQLAEFIYEQPARGDIEYIFKHALTQEVAYNSMLQVQRRTLHERIGAAIETLFADRLEDRCGELARHYRLSRDARKAIHYLGLAGEQATSRCAPAEASQHFRAALDALGALPEGQERDRLEFSLQVALGSALTARSWGDTEKERALERARELGRRMGASGELFPVLWHLAESYISIGKLDAALELAAQCLELAQGSGDPVLPVGAHHAMGETCYWIGEPVEARSHFSRAAELYDLQHQRTLISLYGIDPLSLTVSCWAMAESILGAPDRAAELTSEVVAHAKALGHPYSLAFALSVVAWACQMRFEVEEASELARAAIALCAPNGFAEMLAVAGWVEGWVLFERGNQPEGVARMTEELAPFRFGSTPGQTLMRSVIVEALARVGRIDEALATIAQVEQFARQANERIYEAETRRLRGEIELMRNPPRRVEGERFFREALEIAQARAAKWWELRATTSLAKLLRDTDRRDEARAMLAEIYSWFTEGFDTADLKDASALLGELSD